MQNNHQNQTNLHERNLKIKTKINGFKFSNKEPIIKAKLVSTTVACICNPNQG